MRYKSWLAATLGDSSTVPLGTSGNSRYALDNHLLESLAQVTGRELNRSGSVDDTIAGAKTGKTLIAFDQEQKRGTKRNDLLIAIGNENQLDGLGGNDILYAFGTNNHLSGGQGDDTFYAIAGGNTFTGGAGADKFWLGNGSLPVTPTIITDFDVNEDVIGIKGLYRFNDKGEVVRAINSIGQDIRITQEGNDTILSVVTSSIEVPFQASTETTQKLAILKDIDASLISPLYVLNKFYDGVNQFVASFTDSDPTNDGDFSGIKAVLADDVVWELGGPTDKLSWSGQRIGSAAVEDFFKKIGNEVLFENFRREGALVQGNVVASLAAERTLVYATNKVYVTGAVDLFETNSEGKISHGTIVLDTFPIVQTYQGGRPFTIDGDPANQFVPDFSGRTTISQRNPIIFDAAPAFDPVEVAQKQYAGVGQFLSTGSFDGLSEVLADDVRWFVYGPQDINPNAGERYGKAGVQDYWNTTSTVVNPTSFTPQIFIVDGDRVVIASNVTAQAKVVQYDAQGNLVPEIDPATGQQKLSPEYKLVEVHLIDVNADGKVESFKDYLDSFPTVQNRLGGRPFTINGVDGLGYSVPSDLQDFL